jgi:hypothetical protein
MGVVSSESPLLMLAAAPRLKAAEIGLLAVPETGVRHAVRPGL